MRVNVYAEEMTGNVEIVEKETDGNKYHGVRFYLHLPVTMPDGRQVQGPFMHRPDDDDSSAVTFWGKRDLRLALWKAVELLDGFYVAGPSVPRPLKISERIRAGIDGADCRRILDDVDVQHLVASILSTLGFPVGPA